MAIAKIIKYEGDNSVFVWKYPATDFNALSQLIVHENQEAVFFKNGQALDLFEAGNRKMILHIRNTKTSISDSIGCYAYVMQDIRDIILMNQQMCI